MQIAMHRIDKEFMASHPQRIPMARDSLHASLAATRDRPQSLGIFANSALSAAAYFYLADPQSEEVASTLQLARQSLNALFACATDTQAATTVSLGPGEPVTYRDKPPSSSVHVGNWLDAFSLNLVFGDLAALRTLCAIPTALLHESPTTSTADRTLFKEALCAYVNQQPDVIDRIIAALKANQAEIPDPIQKAVAIALTGPQLEVFLYAATRDARFGDAMRRAVEEHKQFWGRNRDSARSFKGLISLPLLGLVALARDVGLTCDLETPYLPMRLIQAM
jgi:hypothetical protein